MYVATHIFECFLAAKTEGLNPNNLQGNIVN